MAVDVFQDSIESGKYIEIPTSDWYPSHAELEYPKEFIDWIDSINSGWQNKKEYAPLDSYCKQAEEWLKDDSSITDFDTEHGQREWLERELERMRVNSLYFCNKYGKIKEDKAKDGSGMIQYKAWEAQEVLLFLFDCGYSLMIGKARQIGFTTTMCLAGMKRVNLNKSYFIKFVTHSENKGIEIFNDKVKWAFTKIPEYIAQEVKNWSDNVMSFEKRGGRKGRTQGGGARFQVDTPKVDAINGGSPSAVFVDEIGLMDIFGDMMREGRPALFKFDPATGKMVMQQQFMAWGTGGEMDKGGSVFEAEFKTCLNQWRERNFAYGVIPLFMNAYARPGVNKAHIENEKLAYLSLGDTVKGHKAKVQFHQHYPITIDDMFVRKSNTLRPISECNRRLSEIYNREKPIEYGYFKPIMDVSRPTPGMITDFQIVGAEFVPTTGRDDASTTCVIVNHPPKDEVWINRWFQGTDPINSETGHSKMSSAIWDAYDNSVSSVVFHRERKFKETYLQVLLQSLYYDQEGSSGCKELIENNIGDMHLDFQETHGFKHKFTAQASLPIFLQTQGKWFGISNKTNTAPRIINKIEEMLDAFGDQIDVPWFWEQVKTFVEKDLRSSTSHRQTRYQAADSRYDYDDSIFAIVFAYINSLCYNKYEPENIKEKSSAKLHVRRYVQNKDTGFRKKLALVNKRTGEVVRFIN